MLTASNAQVCTKAFQRLKSKIDWSRQHLELSDAAFRILKEFVKQNAKPSDSIAVTLGKGFPAYECLNHGVRYLPNAIGFSNQQNYEATLIGSYADFTEYLHGVLSELYRCKPLLVVGKAGGNHQKNFREIIDAGSWEKLTEQMVSHVFRKIEEERSTRKLIEKILDNTNVLPDPALLKSTLAYLELRHLYVHAGGIADTAYVSNFGDIQTCKSGEKVKLSFALTERGLTQIHDLAREIDFELLRRGLANPAASNMKTRHEELKAQFQETHTPKGRETT